MNDADKAGCAIDNLKELDITMGGMRRGELVIIHTPSGGNPWHELHEAFSNAVKAMDTTFWHTVEVNENRVKELVDNMVAENLRKMGKSNLVLASALFDMNGHIFCDAPEQLADNVLKQPRRNGKQKRNPDRWR